MTIRKHFPLVLLMACGLLHAEDLYVAQTSAGGDTGADCANAHSATWFNTSGNWGSGAGKISAGDTAHLCGTITSVLTAQGSGSSGNPVTVLFESGAKMSVAAWVSTGAFVVTGKNYITLDGGTNGIIENTDNGGNLGNQVDSLGVMIDTCTGCVVTGLTIRNIYVQGSAAGTLGTCLEVLNSSNIRVHHNTESTCGYTGEAYGFSTATTFSSVEFDHQTYSNSCAAFKVTDFGANSHVTGLSWHDNDVTLPGATYAPEAGCHVNGIHIFMVNANSSFTDGGFYYNNYIHGDIGTHSTAYMFFENTVATATVNPNVFNNLFVNTNNSNPASNGFIYVGDMAGDTGGLIANNTMTSVAGPVASGMCWTIWEHADVISVKNNLCNVDGGGSSLNSTSVTGSHVDYNLYAGTGTSNDFTVPAGNVNNFTAWSSTPYFYDVHGSNPSAASAQIQAGTYLLGVGSTAIGAATNLTSLGITALNSDKVGVARPTTGAWGIGAYQYAGGSPQTSVFGVTLQGVIVK